MAVMRAEMKAEHLVHEKAALRVGMSADEWAAGMVARLVVRWAGMMVQMMVG